MKNEFSSRDFTLGILGGGQLGRMLLQRTADFNISTAVMDGDAEAPCRFLCDRFVNEPFSDYDAVYKFGKTVSLLTVEIEHVNTEALIRLESEGLRVFPQPSILELIKDKGLQKEFYKNHYIPTAGFYLADDKSGIKTKNFPFVQKMRKGGYDGKGVVMLTSPDDIEQKAFNVPSVIEEAIDFKKEIAVIAARNSKGEVKTFPPCEMDFNAEANLVEYLFAPADLPESLEKEAKQIAITIVNELGLTGLLAVEMFVTKNNTLLVNEIAPRPHNSGHHTIEANITSQYEQHLRAILNLPLGDTGAYCMAAMINLLGEKGFEGPAHYEGLEEALMISGVHVHLYGKKTTKPFRKMGHITLTGDSLESVRNKAEAVKNLVKVKSLNTEKYI